MIQRKRKAIAEINVVPYIDVMLVLLIIFMITAPLLQLGVEIELPQSQAQPMDETSEPVVVNVVENGDFYLAAGGDDAELIDGESLKIKVQAFLERNPDLSVLIGGDQRVPYGRVYEAMVILQSAGAQNVGLMSDPLEDSP